MPAWLRRYPLTLLAFSLLALYGIAASTGMLAALSAGPTPTSRPSTPPPLASVSDPIPRMALVYDLPGRGSAGFNELAWEGAKRAADKLSAELKEVTAQPGDTDADREARLEDLAGARYSPIFVIGATYAEAVTKVAPKYPSTWFAIIDDGSVDAPNVIGILFHDEQGSFLVGAAAALTSKTGIVGFIGAARIPSLQSFEAGFTAGARAADSHVKVRVAYLSPSPGETGPSDPAKARDAALAMYDAGVDVIFGTVGDSGNGVIQAAHERGRWAIGVTSDQYLLSDPSLRGAILTSMLKRADVATYVIAMEVANGVPKDGTNVFGVGPGGVGYATSGGFVDSLKAQLDVFAARIAAGEILVPTTP
ncbi:MAG: basic rane protein [Chloroflexota bacterium]|nr:basic rane protein [Chloroflexota bacterium]